MVKTTWKPQKQTVSFNMAHTYHHSLSSVKKFGGVVEDYLPLHNWFDESKSFIADNRHRVLRHHAEGIFMLEKLFGVTITNSDKKKIPTRFIGEQHVFEDLGRIPSFQDYLVGMHVHDWMRRGRKLTQTETGEYDEENDTKISDPNRIHQTIL